jgi:hypothetical protein
MTLFTALLSSFFVAASASFYDPCTTACAYSTYCSLSIVKSQCTATMGGNFCSFLKVYVTGLIGTIYDTREFLITANAVNKEAAGSEISTQTIPVSVPIQCALLPLTTTTTTSTTTTTPCPTTATTPCPTCPTTKPTTQPTTKPTTRPTRPPHRSCWHICKETPGCPRGGSECVEADRNSGACRCTHLYFNKDKEICYFRNPLETPDCDPVAAVPCKRF